MINLLFLHLRTFDKCFNTTSRINVAEKCIFQTKISAFAGNGTGQDRRQVCWRILERSGVKSEKWNVCIFMGPGDQNLRGLSVVKCFKWEQIAVTTTLLSVNFDQNFDFLPLKGEGICQINSLMLSKLKTIHLFVYTCSVLWQWESGMWDIFWLSSFMKRG